MEFNNNQKRNFARPCKVILTGIPNVGKTSIFNRMIYNEFRSDTLLENAIKSVKIGNLNVEFEFVDTGGVEKFRTMTESFFVNCNIIFFVFAINNRKSFDELKFIDENVCKITNQEVIKVLIGNKSDLEGILKIQDCESLQHDIGCKEFRMISAKTGDGFQDLLKCVSNHWIDTKMSHNPGLSKVPSITPVEQNNYSDTFCNCCTLL